MLTKYFHGAIKHTTKHSTHHSHTFHHSSHVQKRSYSQVTGDNFHKYAVNLYNQHGVIMTGGKGSWLTDSKGKKYVDFHAQYASVPFGHAPDPFKTIFDDLFDGDIPMVHGAFYKDSMEQGAKRLAKKTSESLDLDGNHVERRVFFNNTGAEAVELAIKLGRLYGTKVKGLPDNDGEEKLIVAMKGCFHGRAFGGTSLFDPSYKVRRDGFGPLLPGISHLTWNDVTGTEQYLSEYGKKIAAIIMEPIQGEGGINMPSPEFISTIARLCKENQIAIIADEVQSGIHRSGPFWASQLFLDQGFKPNIITSAKALGGGIYPVAGVIMDESMAQLLAPGMHGSTFGGNNIAMAVLNKTLDVIEEENIAENVRIRATELDETLTALQQIFPQIITKINGNKGGLWRGIELNPDLNPDKVIDALIEWGVTTGGSGRNVLRIAPPLNISQEDLLEGCNRLAQGFKAISKNLETYVDNPTKQQGMVK